MHPETEHERKRIFDKLHDFCRGDTMLGKGCLSCPLDSLDVCNEHPTKKYPMSKLKEAERIIDEVMSS